MSEKSEPLISRDIHDKEHPFVMISREMLLDTSISPKAKGVLVFILAQKDNWKIYHSQLCHALNIGKDYLDSAIRELINAGYCSRQRVQLKGQYQPYHYRFSEYKKFKEKIPKRKNRSGKTAAEKPPVTILPSLTEKAYEETTTTKQQEPVVVSSDQSKEIIHLIRKSGLNPTCFDTVINLNPSIDTLTTALECLRKSKAINREGFLIDALRNQWKASKSINELESEALSALSDKIEARRTLAMQLNRNVPSVPFTIRENRIEIMIDNRIASIGFADDDIDNYLKQFYREL